MENLIEDQLFIFTRATCEKLLEECPDAYLLYGFYRLVAFKQKTNRVWATKEFVKNGLKWGDDKYKRVNDYLVKNGFIKIIKNRDEDVGTFGKTYVQINYIFTNEFSKNITKNTASETEVYRKPVFPSVVLPNSGTCGTNALSNTNINALSKCNRNALSKEPPIIPQDGGGSILELIKSKTPDIADDDGDIYADLERLEKSEKAARERLGPGYFDEEDDTTEQSSEEVKEKEPTIVDQTKPCDKVELLSDADWVIKRFNEICGVNVRMTPKKQEQLRQRLKSFTKEELEYAITARMSSEWHITQGWTKDWNSLFCNDEKIDRFVSKRNEVKSWDWSRLSDKAVVEIIRREGWRASIDLTKHNLERWFDLKMNNPDVKF